MKLKIIFTFISVMLLLSCNNGKRTNGEDEEHEEHSSEGIVMLTQKQREALDLKLGTFQMRNLTTIVKTNGQLKVPPEASAEVTAIIGGNVKEIKVFHGDKVSKGQVLAILEHPDYIAMQEDFAEMASKLEFLEQEFNRQKALFENNVGAGKDFQQVKSDYNIAKARYEGLKLRLELLHLSPEEVKDGKISKTITIESPIDGYVNEVNIKVGTYADSKNKLFDITDNDQIHADFMVYENDVHLLKNGQKVDLITSNLPGEELSASIFAIGKEFETNTRAVHAHAKLDRNPGNLIPGMYVSGHIHTDENYTRTLPNEAIVTEGSNTYVFILDNSNHSEKSQTYGISEENENSVESNEQTMDFRMVEVITGKTDEGYTEIKLLSPLPEDTQVVQNVAYYLLADLKKKETEHDH